MIIAFVPEWMYRLLYIRYLFAAALGVWLAISYKRSTKWLIIGALINFIYIFAVNYLNFQVRIIYPAWLSQHAPSYFWTLSIIIIGLIYLSDKSKNIVQSVIEKLGQASWHIFLVQMAFFWTGGSVLKFLFFGDFILPNTFDILSLIHMSINGLMLTCMNLGICPSLGYLFYLVESKKNLLQRY